MADNKALVSALIVIMVALLVIGSGSINPSALAGNLKNMTSSPIPNGAPVIKLSSYVIPTGTPHLTSTSSGTERIALIALIVMVAIAAAACYAMGRRHAGKGTH